MEESPPGPGRGSGQMQRTAVRLTFEACFRAHRDRVFRLGLRYGRGRMSWAEDLTQDVFMKLYQELPRLSAHEDLGGWLYRVTSNAALSRLRRERSVLGQLDRLLAGSDEVAEAGADATVEQSQTASEAQALLDALPPRERVVLGMKVLDGMAQKDIAVALGMSEGYVSKLLTRAWEQIRAAGWEVPDEG
jgi:RNA polymerase sigma factor (sigma-70 family)